MRRSIRRSPSDADKARSPGFTLRRLVIVLAATVAVGCGAGGPRIVPTSGVVLMNGKPLVGHGGFVRVVPAGARPATGRIDPADGRFTLTTYETGDGCVEGTHPASVIVNTTVGNRLIWIAPERYGNEATSGLTVDIKDAPAELELGLEGGLAPVPVPSSADKRMQEAG